MTIRVKADYYKSTIELSPDPNKSLNFYLLFLFYTVKNKGNDVKTILPTHLEEEKQCFSVYQFVFLFCFVFVIFGGGSFFGELVKQAFVLELVQRHLKTKETKEMEIKVGNTKNRIWTKGKFGVDLKCPDVKY